MEPDVLLCNYNNECYEYVAVYVDDLAFAMKDPEPFVQSLKDDFGFN